MKLTIQEIYEAARAAGFTPDQATTWTAIALAESGGETGALNDQGEHSMGLWQINVAPGVRTNSWGNLNDPLVNARAAYEISNHGTDMRPWTTTHASNQGTSADYRTYLDDVSAITGYTGDPRGVEGYGSPLPDPLPPSGPPDSYDAIDAGIDPTDPGANLDTDEDGLTDAFEMLSGSSPSVADTDQDGLSDAQEVAVSHTDPMLADTDQDTLADATETALGTSATEWDSDSDGASDGVETTYGTDPLRAEHGTVPQPADDLTNPMGGTTVGDELDPGGAGSTTTAGWTGTGAGTGTGSGTLADAFIQAAVDQQGDSYVFGAEASLDDPDPDSFDCSELTQWAADQVGVTIPDGAMYQYLDLKSQGQLMPVEEALHTKGALLFYFSDEPTASGGRPSEAHVAISLGDGRTIEARGTSYGVNEFPAEGRFNYAGVIPELSGPAPEGFSFDGMGTGIDTGMLAGGELDSDADGLSDTFERLAGLDPLSSDSDQDGLDDAMEALGGQGSMVPAGLSESLESLAPGLDEDRDGLSNKYELAHGLDPFDVDTDSDSLSDSAETALGTDPTLVDSDSDGLTDQWELEFGGGNALGNGGSTSPWTDDLDTAPVGGGDLGDQDDLLG